MPRARGGNGRYTRSADTAETEGSRHPLTHKSR